MLPSFKIFNSIHHKTVYFLINLHISKCVSLNKQSCIYVRVICKPRFHLSTLDFSIFNHYSNDFFSWFFFLVGRLDFASPHGVQDAEEFFFVWREKNGSCVLRCDVYSLLPFFMKVYSCLWMIVIFPKIIYTSITSLRRGYYAEAPIARAKRDYLLLCICIILTSKLSI